MAITSFSLCRTCLKVLAYVRQRTAGAGWLFRQRTHIGMAAYESECYRRTFEQIFNPKNLRYNFRKTVTLDFPRGGVGPQVWVPS